VKAVDKITARANESGDNWAATCVVRRSSDTLSSVGKPGYAVCFTVGARAIVASVSADLAMCETGMTLGQAVPTVLVGQARSTLGLIFQLWADQQNTSWLDLK